MSIRTKSSELSLFNPKKQLCNYSAPPMGMSNRLINEKFSIGVLSSYTTIYEIISLNLQRQTAPLVSVRKMMIVKLPQKNNELEDKNISKWY